MILSAPARLGREIEGDELPGSWIEDRHGGLLFCWRRRNAASAERIKRSSERSKQFVTASFALRPGNKPP